MEIDNINHNYIEIIQEFDNLGIIQDVIAIDL